MSYLLCSKKFVITLAYQIDSYEITAIQSHLTCSNFIWFNFMPTQSDSFLPTSCLLYPSYQEGSRLFPTSRFSQVLSFPEPDSISYLCLSIPSVFSFLFGFHLSVYNIAYIFYPPLLPLFLPSFLLPVSICFSYCKSIQLSSCGKILLKQKRNIMCIHFKQSMTV